MLPQQYSDLLLACVLGRVFLDDLIGVQKMDFDTVFIPFLYDFCFYDSCSSISLESINTADPDISVF